MEKAGYGAGPKRIILFPQEDGARRARRTRCCRAIWKLVWHLFLLYCAVLSGSVVSDSLSPHRLYPARLLCPWGFSRQEYWSGLPCIPPGDLPNSGNESRSPALKADSLLSEQPDKSKISLSSYPIQPHECVCSSLAFSVSHFIILHSGALVK